MSLGLLAYLNFVDLACRHISSFVDCFCFFMSDRMKLKAVVPQWEEQLCRDMFNLHTSQLLCDVLIDVKNCSKLPVHSSILAAGNFEKVTHLELQFTKIFVCCPH